MAIRLEPSARNIAAYVLDRVFRENAFAAAVLDAAIDRFPELDPRERALATELTYGSLRTAPHIEARLAQYATRSFHDIDPTVRAHLLIAGYQILFLERVPAFAAVSEGVRQISFAKDRRVGAFANAILRRLSEEPVTDKRAALVRAERESVAPWLYASLARSLGESAALAFVTEAGAPPIGLRVRRAEDRGALVEELRATVKGATFEQGVISPLAISMRGGSDPKRLALYRDGRLAIQEEGAQVIALSLGAAPGDTVLDACAGRGNKTALLLELVGITGAVDAADQHPQKLIRLAAELRRLDLSARATYAVDWTVGSGDVPSDYDRVLVDAPCSGVGTIRRRPDLATRRQASSLAELGELQVNILLRAAEHLKEGGTLLYAVCSVLREECEDVIERARVRAPWLGPVPFASGPAERWAAGGSTLRLTPNEHGTDGYFLALLTRGVREGSS